MPGFYSRIRPPMRGFSLWMNAQRQWSASRWESTRSFGIASAQCKLQDNQTGVENKHFKPEQYVFFQLRHFSLTRMTRFYEALRDPKTWLFAFFSAMDNIPNSLTNQRQIIVSSFGFSNLQTTLLGCVDGVIEIVTIFTGVKLAARYKNSRAYVGAIYFIPNILGVLLLNLLPWDNQVGLLFSQWVTGESLNCVEWSMVLKCLVRRWDYWLCASPFLALKCDCWAYETCNGQCYFAHSLLRWQCRGPIHVAG